MFFVFMEVNMPYLNIFSKIDYTFLKADGAKDAVRRLCRTAQKYGCAAVCVNPCEVGFAAQLLKDSNVAVCTVVGFPLGQNTFAMKCAEAADAIAHGATELDYVINVRLLKHDPVACEDELVGLVSAARALREDLILKLIIECCYLTRAEKVRACQLAQKAGFDFVKTSTGFGTGGATVEDVQLMRKTVGPQMGIKAAGGIRTRAFAEDLLAAGATRLGCSDLSGLKV